MLFSRISAIVATGVLMPVLAASPAHSQDPAPPHVVHNGAAAPAIPSNERQAFLVQQDNSDCTNSTVPTSDSSDVRGYLWINQDPGGTTGVRIAMTVTPKTRYHLFLKCVRQLGDIVTDDEGVGFANFSFPTASIGSTYAFDMYPDGAPSGHKYQSVTIRY